MDHNQPRGQLRLTIEKVSKLTWKRVNKRKLLVGIFQKNVTRFSVIGGKKFVNAIFFSGNFGKLPRFRKAKITPLHIKIHQAFL